MSPPQKFECEVGLRKERTDKVSGIDNGHIDATKPCRGSWHAFPPNMADQIAVPEFNDLMSYLLKHRDEKAPR